MKRFLRAALAPIGLFIATTLLGIASNTHLFDALLLKYINNEKVVAVKEIINLANFIVLVLPLGIQSIIRGVKANKAKVLMEKYGERQRKYLFAILSEKKYITGGSENDFNIRVFRKKGGFLECVSKRITAKIMQEGYGCRPDKRKQGNGKRAYHSEWRLCGTP